MYGFEDIRPVVIQTIHDDDYNGFVASIGKYAQLSPDLLGRLLHEINIPWTVYPAGRYQAGIRILSYLLSRDADVNSKNRYGQTLLCSILSHNTVTGYGEYRENPTFLSDKDWLHYNEAYRACVKMIELILEAGADINAFCQCGDEDLNNALSLCVYYGDKEILRLMLDYAAERIDPEILETAYELAVAKNNGEILKLLLLYTATPDLVEFAMDAANLNHRSRMIGILSHYRRM